MIRSMAKRWFRSVMWWREGNLILEERRIPNGSPHDHVDAIWEEFKSRGLARYTFDTETSEHVIQQLNEDTRYARKLKLRVKK